MPIASMSKITDESVKKGTGRGWQEWIAVIDKAGGRVWSHQDIVAFLKQKHKLKPWWQQMVTTSYEIAIGRREEGQNQRGFYSAAASRTFPISKSQLWKLVNSREGLDVWLRPVNNFKIRPGQKFETSDEYFGEVRTMKAGERVRLRWQEVEWEKPTVVNIFLGGRDRDKSILAISHDDLPDTRLRNRMRSHWKQVLINLIQLCKKS